MLELKSGCGWSFKNKLEEHTAGTPTSSEGLVWLIESIVSYHTNVINFPDLSHRHFAILVDMIE